MGHKPIHLLGHQGCQPHRPTGWSTRSAEHHADQPIGWSTRSAEDQPHRPTGWSTKSAEAGWSTLAATVSASQEAGQRRPGVPGRLGEPGGLNQFHLRDSPGTRRSGPVRAWGASSARAPSTQRGHLDSSGGPGGGPLRLEGALEKPAKTDPATTARPSPGALPGAHAAPLRPPRRSRRLLAVPGSCCTPGHPRGQPPAC